MNYHVDENLPAEGNGFPSFTYLLGGTPELN